MTDKGFSSQKNRELIERLGWLDGIQYRAHPRKPLQDWQKQINKIIGKMRWRIEQAFGTLKRRFHMSRARYFSARKVEAQMRLAAIGYNLLKAHRMIKGL